MKQMMRSEAFLLFLVSLLVVSVFSTCSFLYPLNPWDDANVYMTIGNAMLAGRELYVDVFDHKGPVLFFLHEWAAMLSRSSFVGIYLVEIACCFGYLWYSLRTMRLFSSGSALFPLVCLHGIVTYSSDFFSYGDSVEEFSLPILAHCLYFMLRFVKEGRLPSGRHAFLMGTGLALILWMKFNILFFYAGGIVALAFLSWRHGRLAELGRVVLWACAGVVAATVPVVAYFAIHGTLGALYEAYFAVNIFQYHGVASNGEPDVWWFPLVKLAIWVVLMIPLFLLRVRREVKLLLAGTYGVLCFSFATLTVQFYYFLLLFTFFPVLVCFLPEKRLTWRAYLLMAAVALAGTATNWNLVTLLNGTFPRRVFEMAEIINANGSDDSEVLTFSSYDTGIYQHTRHLPPNCNFFLSSILSPDIRKEQAEWVASGKVKYLVREIGAVKTCHEYYDVPVPENYRLVYDEEELFRYRFITTPHKFLWNLTYPRVLLRHVMNPVTLNQRMQVYERQP